jgi:hypothetical protein
VSGRNTDSPLTHSLCTIVIHVYRYLTALTVLLVMCSTYALAVAPWFEPPPIAKLQTTAEAPPTPPASQVLLAELAQLFPPDHWVHKSPKIVETEQATLLIQKYSRLEDGRLKLEPCLLIFHSAAGDPKTQPRGRPIVLEAPKAELTFDRPLDLGRATFGRVEKGTLSGEISIRSPATLADGRDELLVTTSSVWIDRQSIRTLHPVKFKYGDSKGLGRDLEIVLFQDQADKPRKTKSKMGGVQTVTLKHLDYLHVATEGRGLLGEPLAAGSKDTANDNAPIEVTCQGEFAFDVPAQLARFDDRVEVRRLIPDAPPDRLRCMELLLALAPRRTQPDDPAATAADPLAGRLQRIIAIGSPAVLDGASSGLFAEAAFMEYSVAERYVTLKSDPKKHLPQVSLRQHEQHFVAPGLHYKMAEEEGRLGRLHAGGPGELRLLQGRGPAQQIVTARWERELQIQPQERNQVISLQGAASVTVDPLGRFDANELHLWVLEVPAEQPAAAEPAPATTEKTKADKPRFTLIPDRLLGIGNVRVVSQRLDVDTSRLETWFINLPAEPPKIQPLTPPGPIREPASVQPAAFTPTNPSAGAIRNVVRPPNPQRFHVGGGLIRMQLVVRGRQFDLEDLDIRGQAEIDETRTAEPGQEPTRIRGELLAVRHGTQPDATLEVSGQPAEVGARGTTFAGGKIEVRRADNQMLIRGPGEATLPASQGTGNWGQGTGDRGREPGAAGGLLPVFSQPLPPGPPDKMHIVWQQGFDFNGLVACFNGDVQIRTATQTAHTPRLEATFSQRIDFQMTGQQPQPDVAGVFLDGGSQGVYLEGRSLDPLGEQISREQLKARDLVFNRSLGKLHVTGPGWVNTVRRGGGGLPGAPGGQQPMPAHASASPTDPQPLTSIHVVFERAIEGDLNRREIEFQQQVQTTYSPASDFSDVIVADPLGNLGERMVLMQSDSLKIIEFIQPTARWFEMEATGHTQVRATRADIDAPIIGYSSANEVLTLKGDGRAKARIFVPQATGQQPGSLVGDRLRYNLRTGEGQADVVDSIHLNLPQGIKVPAPSLPTAPKRKK